MERSSVDLLDVLAFVRVVETGAFSRAAERMGMSKSILSRRVARLEEQLRRAAADPDRAGRASRPTSARPITSAPSNILAELEAAEEVVAEAVTQVAGPIRLTRAAVVRDRTISRRLSPSSRRRIRRSSSTSRSTTGPSTSPRGGFDLAVRIGSLPDSALVARRIAPVRKVPVASPAYLDARGRPEHPRDLAGHDILLYANEQWRFRVGKQLGTCPRPAADARRQWRDASRRGGGRARHLHPAELHRRAGLRERRRWCRCSPIIRSRKAGSTRSCRRAARPPPGFARWSISSSAGSGPSRPGIRAGWRGAARAADGWTRRGAAGARNASDRLIERSCPVKPLPLARLACSPPPARPRVPDAAPPASRASATPRRRRAGRHPAGGGCAAARLPRRRVRREHRVEPADPDRARHQDRLRQARTIIPTPSAQRQRDLGERQLARMKAEFDPARLSPAGRLSYRLFEYDVKRAPRAVPNGATTASRCRPTAARRAPSRSS